MMGTRGKTSIFVVLEQDSVGSLALIRMFGALDIILGVEVGGEFSPSFDILKK